MTAPDPIPDSIISTGGVYIGGNVDTGGGNFAGRDMNIFMRSQREELHDYFASAVPLYATVLMQRVLSAQSQQFIKEPYKFLDSFDLEDTNFFFGRSTAVHALYEAVSHNRLTVLHAKSGAGKTSLLNAGLAPRLIMNGRLPIYARALQDPVQAVKRAVLPMSAGPWPDQLNKLSLSEFLGFVYRHRPPNVQELVLVLDQFEEFFIFWPLREQRQPFVDDFAKCYYDSQLPVQIVLSLRKDYYSDLAEFGPFIPTVFRSQLRLDPMERTQVAMAITKPVIKLENPVAYTPDLLDAILDDLVSSGVELPHMQIVCKRLYEARVASTKLIDLSTYERLGRARGILGNYLNGMLVGYPDRTQTVAKAVLKELVTSEATKRALPYSTLVRRVKAAPSDLDDTLTFLVNDRLLRRDDVEDEIIYEMAHEYLITEIKQWIDTSDLAFKQVEELLSREVINWRIHRTLIPRDRLELIYTQRSRLGNIDDATGECLLRSALQSDFAVEGWMHCVANANIRPLVLLSQDPSIDFARAECRLHAVRLLGSFSDANVVEPLVESLADPNVNVRWGAAVALGKLGDVRAVAPLIDALADAKVRRAATTSLGKLGDARAVEPLIGTLADVNASVRRAAVEALGRLGDARAVEPLIEAIADADMRWAAADALGRIGDTRAVGPLIEALANADMRWEAVEALSKLGDAAVEPLIETLANSDANVRRAAADTLGKLACARALEPLLEMLADVSIRSVTVKALGMLGDSRAVEPLMGLLEDVDGDVRSAAVVALGKLGDERALEPLIKNLKSADKNFSGLVADALGQLGDDRAVEPLLGILEDADRDERSAAARALGKLGDVCAVESLIEALKDGDGDVRSAAVEALGMLGEIALEPLTGILADADRDGNVRSAAAEALGKLGDMRAVESLIVALNDGYVCWEAAEALGRLGALRSVGLLIDTLKDENANWWVRTAAATALGNLGDARAVEPLISNLADLNVNVRSAAADALGKLGDVRAVGPLIEVLADIDVRWTAAEALGKLGDARAVEPLIGTLKSADMNVRRATAEALGRLGDGRAVESLIGTLKSADKDTRRASAEALGKLGDARAVASLITGLKDTNANVRWAVAQALRAVDTPEALAALDEVD